jgi:hypothetical protein
MTVQVYTQHYIPLSGIAGLAVTYGLNLNTLQAWVVWSMCNLENGIISVERILQYISIPEEPPLSMSEDKLAHNWPSEGEIQLHNLHVNPSFCHSIHQFCFPA